MASPKELLQEIKSMERDHQRIVNKRIDLLIELQELEKKENELTSDINTKKTKFRKLIEEKQKDGKKKEATGLSRLFFPFFQTLNLKILSQEFLYSVFKS